MNIRQVDIKTLDDCLDVLETSIKSDLWKQLDSQEQLRLIARLDHTLTSAYERFRNPIQLVDMCIDILQVALLSSMQVTEQGKTRLIGRLSYILEMAEKKELKE
jgi:hypothetical protein